MIERFHAGPAGANRVAIVFVHGFTGDRKRAWGAISGFLEAEPRLAGWDLFGFGYESSARFDLMGLWSADADLEQLATALFSVPELLRYERLAWVAHSMGGLVVQRALVKYEDLRQRTSHVVLFGTPSKGLFKARLLSFWKQQIRNMSASGKFIRALRSDWQKLNLDTQPRFRFLAVAGETDQFVPPESSLGPFPELVKRVIPGNHLSMLKADSKDAPCVQLLIEALTGGAAAAGPRNAAGLALEMGKFQRTIDLLWPHRFELDDEGARDLAQALDSAGRREDAIGFLEQRSRQGTDVLGVLAGRFKRRWLVGRRRADADRAFELYRLGYSEATAKADHDQAYYHGINLAFLELAYRDDRQAARKMAEAVLAHCQAAVTLDLRFWRLASEGDALIILGRAEEALNQHAEAASHELDPWQALSIQEQAVRTADLCGWSRGEIERLARLYEGGPS